jgi:hypothetical protein
MRTSLHLKFPANREINREFRQIRPSAAILAPSQQANPMACSKIPYATEQGIFLTEQGIFAEEQGIQRNNSDDNRAADNERIFAVLDQRNLVASIFKCRAAASQLCPLL